MSTLYIHADASIVGGAVPSFAGEAAGFNRGIERNGVGDYTLTLNLGLDALNCRVAWAERARAPGAPASSFAYERPDDHTVRIFLASPPGVPADLDVDITVFGTFPAA